MSNNSNSHDLDGEQIKSKTWNNDVVRATVLDVLPDRHAVRVNPRGDNAPFVAPVVTATYGMHVLPKENERVTLLYITENVPIVIGGIYLADGDAPPSVNSGDIVVGNQSGGTITITTDGDIKMSSSDDGSVYIDGVKQ